MYCDVSRLMILTLYHRLRKCRRTFGGSCSAFVSQHTGFHGIMSSRIFYSCLGYIRNPSQTQLVYDVLQFLLTRFIDSRRQIFQFCWLPSVYLQLWFPPSLLEDVSELWRDWSLIGTKSKMKTSCGEAATINAMVTRQIANSRLKLICM